MPQVEKKTEKKKIGKKIYDKVLGELAQYRIGGKAYGKDNTKDRKEEDRKEFTTKTEKLDEYLREMYIFFDGVRTIPTLLKGEKEKFEKASGFCYDTSVEVSWIGNGGEESFPVRNYSDQHCPRMNYYDSFDEALDSLFQPSNSLFQPSNNNKNGNENGNENGKKTVIDEIFGDIYRRKKNEVVLGFLENPSTECIYRGEKLLKGIRGLQSYLNENVPENEIDEALNKNLNEKISQVENVVQFYKKKRDDSIYKHIADLNNAISSSHRWRKNSSEYDNMLQSARALSQGWKIADEKERKRLLKEASVKAEFYMLYKTDGSYDWKHWKPKTKEGQNRFDLANNLYKTIELLKEKDLTNPYENEIKTAKAKIRQYQGEYKNATDEKKRECIAKAAAVNVICNIVCNLDLPEDKLKLKKLFSDKNIKMTAEKIKTTKWFSQETTDELKKKVFTKQTLMKRSEINTITDEMAYKPEIPGKGKMSDKGIGLGDNKTKQKTTENDKVKLPG